MVLIYNKLEFGSKNIQFHNYSLFLYIVIIRFFFSLFVDECVEYKNKSLTETFNAFDKFSRVVCVTNCLPVSIRLKLPQLISNFSASCSCVKPAASLWILILSQKFINAIQKRFKVRKSANKNKCVPIGLLYIIYDS